ncbi:MAG: alkaline phosphatase family protein [Thermodesulfovibrionia bacterium]|nr:alkaline phosphatase family protein [Thermodesulfovibrionia bacterium]
MTKTGKDVKFKKVILIGMDGLDPKVLSHLMNQGDLPNFSKLSQLGSYFPLTTSNPAQSPVAWASIATGNNPGYHGVFDFLNRRVTDYMPELAILKMNPKNVFGKRELMFLPVMHGNSFWDHTSSNNIPSTVLKWPMTFQPRQNNAKLYAGLGVPDIKGGLGKYAFYTDRDIYRNEEGFEKVVKVKIDGNRIKTYISGPNIAKLTAREAAKVDLNINILSDNSKIEMDVDGKKITVNRSIWSDWVEVKFKVGLMKTVSGIVKFYLKQINPEFEFYMTAVQINPKDPAFIISSPDDYIRELANELGHFYTLGMPEDTKALEEGRIDEEAFIIMCDEIIAEQEKMLWHELNRFKEGLLASAFFSTDRIQHIFWVTKDPLHPLYDKTYAEKYGHVIDDYYRKMDRILGEVMKQVDDKTAIMVFSDHGFSTFRRTVHINSWLAQNGFMALTQKVSKDDKEGGGLFQYVDWKNTKAYALGFGSIYLNIKRRERQGIVEAGTDAELVSGQIADKLIKLTDPKNGQPAVKKVYKNNNIYSGSQVNNAPELIVGFQEGYRASWQTAVGGSPAEIFEDNLKKWSGDHIMDPSIVPGILLTNFKINTESPNLMDIAPSVLSCFGMSASDMEGKALL